MKDNIDSIVSRIESGSGEECIAALDEYGKQFSLVIAAAAKALVADDVHSLFVADRMMRLAHVVQGVLLPVDVGAAGAETRFLRALVLCQFGDRSELPFLLELASEPGPHQYDAIRQLAFLRLPEVQELILKQLRAVDLSNAEVISGLLHAWKLFGEALPDDLRLRLSSEELSVAIKVALKSLKL